MSNPANGSGTLTSIEIFAETNMSGVKVGTFYLVSGSTYHCRDSESIGNVTAGSKQTFSVSLTIETGDFIGLYFSGGTIEADISSGQNQYKVGDYADIDDEEAFSANNYLLSLYGTGIIPSSSSSSRSSSHSSSSHSSSSHSSSSHSSSSHSSSSSSRSSSSHSSSSHSSSSSSRSSSHSSSSHSSSSHSSSSHSSSSHSSSSRSSSHSSSSHSSSSHSSSSHSSSSQSSSSFSHSSSSQSSSHSSSSHSSSSRSSSHSSSSHSSSSHSSSSSSRSSSHSSSSHSSSSQSSSHSSSSQSSSSSSRSSSHSSSSHSSSSSSATPTLQTDYIHIFSDTVIEPVKASDNKSSVLIGDDLEVQGDTYAKLLHITGIKSGATQVAAGAVAGEIWKTLGHASLPDNVLLIGV
jgi:hypothetical protein